MTKVKDLVERATAFGVDVCRFCRGLPQNSEAAHFASQLRRSASAVGAGYRAAKRARSSREFIAKIGAIIEEADESLHWFECLLELEIGDKDAIAPLRQEADELVAIFTTAHKTAKANLKKHEAKSGSAGR
jgi:four helix bundle protein